MNDYYHLRFDAREYDEAECDILAALLGEVGYESFVVDDKGLSAYVRKEQYSGDTLCDVLKSYPFKGFDVSKELVPGEDWNSEWEKNYFKPIVFENRCCVHSSFHKDYPQVEYDIVIDPRMAFGTGHHETTSLMMERLLNNDLHGKRLLDMGTGTGILAILAAMRGAEEVVGVEIDPPAYDNAVDNVALNATPQVSLRLGGVETVTEVSYFDIVLANINRNIILGDIDKYAVALKSGGILILSGFYTQDVPMIEQSANNCGLTLISVAEKKNWANMCLVKE
ncbi:MAG: 50S ribosomal protein L11 methyltransferase [bacterium]|nr:50S ribosomal protein L11 methyltransferase [bacterium]